MTGWIHGRKSIKDHWIQGNFSAPNYWKHTLFCRSNVNVRLTSAICYQGDGNVAYQPLFWPVLLLIFLSVWKPKRTEINLVCGSIACEYQKVFISHWDISVYQKHRKIYFVSGFLVQVDHIPYSFSLPHVLRDYTLLPGHFIGVNRIFGECCTCCSCTTQCVHAHRNLCFLRKKCLAEGCVYRINSRSMVLTVLSPHGPWDWAKGGAIALATPTLFPLSSLRSLISLSWHIISSELFCALGKELLLPSH